MSRPLTSPPRARKVASGRVGYVVAAVVNAALLLFLNAWPGWEALPFLTDRAGEVIGLVNVSLVVGVVVNIVYVLRDAAWVTALGALVTTGVGLVVLVRIWQVFPLDVAGPAFDATTVVRVLLVIAIVGSVIGLVVQAVAFARAVRGHPVDEIGR
ncbi:MAG: hypothetical protein ACOYXW_00915 [Actinomycetota bacterium]